MTRHSKRTAATRRLAHSFLRIMWPAGVIFAAACLLVMLGVWAPTVTAPSKSATQQAHQQVPDKPKPLPLAETYQFPRGGRILLPNYRLVALYGTPNMPALGALGQQPLPATIARVQELAASYQPYSVQPVLPTLEIIATIASSSPTSNNDYSQELPAAELQPWVTAAQAAGEYVVLDLQPGRSDFLTQAKEYASLLAQPNVGLALDPEWRLTATELPLHQIGTVDITEINSVITWLAQLTAADHLPQKLFVLQQFRSSMITNRAALDTTHSQLAYIIQMDGQGSQDVKLETWQAITASPPANVSFGWKNFYQEDTPLRSPAETMQLAPEPWYVSYE